MSDNYSYRRRTLKKNLPRFFQYLILIFAALFIIVPIVMIIFGALKTRGEFITHPYTIPIPPNWENFAKVLSMPIFWSMLRNSLLVMLAATAGVVIISSMAAFVFSRMKFRGQSIVLNFLTLGLMFPITIAILPVYLVVRQIGLTNNLLGVVLVQMAFQLSICIIILRTSFESVPYELQEAAYIDGCSTFGFFWRILLPLSRPALAAIASLTMVTSWNDLLVPLVLIDKNSLWTLPLGTMQFQGEYGVNLALVAAFVTLSAVPAVIFYLLAERQLVSGLTAGALKG
ncbi:carbohydrate ABC transporter permease [Candidatus Cryosericum septentrionale]|jgi:raffinose/stachyose/melibiose transport system permease protein|uniref:Carbohydrate ABC transporter permease n=1 Tax=Candidatus Cryosericum septentrionale TaxID=2290913 RepID=A0A398DN49_9BACT|nr:carbohydrate ABC transporter permease [Candidatus Cryosericum septentrionale]RIE17052.1 carbohydrate ABC transporter permease [Candidatus Cryosericum septentrionale]